MTALAMRSKAHWGYDAAFMAAAEAELTVTPGKLAAFPHLVAERDSVLLGLASLEWDEADRAAGTAYLALMFVDPDAMGSGAGAALFEAICHEALEAGFKRLLIESDPQAEGFYLRMGAVRTGDAPSASIPGRFLPLLEMAL